MAVTLNTKQHLFLFLSYFFVPYGDTQCDSVMHTHKARICSTKYYSQWCWHHHFTLLLRQTLTFLFNSLRELIHFLCHHQSPHIPHTTPTMATTTTEKKKKKLKSATTKISFSTFDFWMGATAAIINNKSIWKRGKVNKFCWSSHTRNTQNHLVSAPNSYPLISL